MTATASAHEDPLALARGARWSLATKCVRMACLHLDGHTPEPVSDEVRGYQERGHIFEPYVERQLRELYPDATIVREAVVPWPHGEIHADFWIEDEQLIVEHKSRTSLEELDSDWLQLAGQIHYHPTATRGELWITHPSSLEQRRLPFYPTPWWTARVLDVAQRIARRHADGLPNRICTHPSQARSHFCRFAIACFDDWQPPHPLHLDEEGERMAVELYRVQRQLQHSKGDVDGLTKQRDDLRAALADRLLNGADYTIPADGGEVRVRRTVSADGVTYDIKAAIAAGVVSEQQLAPFAKTRKGAERWTVDATGDPDIHDNDMPDF
jgi:hypothetical protein